MYIITYGEYYVKSVLKNGEVILTKNIHEASYLNEEELEIAREEFKDTIARFYELSPKELQV